MEPYRITYDELIPYVIAANIAFGFLFGTFPLIAGLIVKNRKYGFFGFVGSVFGGGVLGVFLAYPIALVFVWLILRKLLVQAGDGAATSASEPTTADADPE